MEKIKVKNVKPVSENAIVLPEPVKPPSGYALAILMAMQIKHVYQGTVSAATKERRRKANRAARKARRANRG